MKRVLSIIIALALLLFSVNALSESTETVGVLGQSYDFDNISAKFVAYHVEQINGMNYIYVEFEFTNNSTTLLSFENSAWILPTQDGDQCFIHASEIPNINLIDLCKPSETAKYTNAFILNSMTTEVVVDVYPMSQFTKRWDERTGEIFFHLDIANEPKAIADGYEWGDL